MRDLERGQGLIEYTLIAVLIAVMVIVIGAVLYMISVNPQDVYERAYNDCIARETIDSERCHDIALMEAYPEQRRAIVNP